jgi:hypothetical protein
MAFLRLDSDRHFYSRDDLTGVVVPQSPKGHKRPANVVGNDKS